LKRQRTSSDRRIRHGACGAVCSAEQAFLHPPPDRLRRDAELGGGAADRDAVGLVVAGACGGESFLAGTASCRIEVEDVDALFAELAAAQVLNRVSSGGVTVTDFGTREFATVDLDNNGLAFFRWENR